MREVHGPEEQDIPSAVHPALPVHVGDVSHAEQTNRQVLLARAIPSDLLAAERLMAAEYTQFVRGQIEELRCCLPENPPEPFRAARYYSSLELAVWERDEAERIEQVLTNVPVQPGDGSADRAEEQKRRKWIENMTLQQLQAVHAHVCQKWEVHRTSGPEWMRSLMPAEAPAAFWRTEYYASMTEVMEAYDEESECPVVRERSELDTAQNQLMRAGSPSVAAEKDLT